MIQKIAFVLRAIRWPECRSALQTSSWALAQDPGFSGIGHAERAVRAAADLMMQLWTLVFAQGDGGERELGSLTAALDVLDLLSIPRVEACDFAG